MGKETVVQYTCDRADCDTTEPGKEVRTVQDLSDMFIPRNETVAPDDWHNENELTLCPACSSLFDKWMTGNDDLPAASVEQSDAESPESVCIPTGIEPEDTVGVWYVLATEYQVGTALKMAPQRSHKRWWVTSVDEQHSAAITRSGRTGSEMYLITGSNEKFCKQIIGLINAAKEA